MGRPDTAIEQSMSRTSRCRACNETDCWCVGCGRPCWLPCVFWYPPTSIRHGDAFPHARESKRKQTEHVAERRRLLGLPEQTSS